MRRLLLLAIRAYQRFISPHKGFACAWRVHTGGASCSQLGHRAVRRHGVVGGLVLLRRRTLRCGAAHRRFHPPSFRLLPAQRGDCDLGCDAAPCDGLDGGSGRGWSRCGDLLSCCDCGSCDWGDRRRERRRKDAQVHVPPRRGPRAPGAR